MKRWDQHLWLALLLTAAIVVPRAVIVCGAQSEGFDDEYHLSRGLDYWYRALEPARLNDPPLGEGISALPLFVAGCRVPSDGHVLYGQRFSTQTLLVMVGVWKAILFLPLVGFAFCWLRKVYGVQAGWAGALLLACEPNFAAFMPNPGLDVLGAEGIFFACLLAWRYFEKPTIARLSAMCIVTAFAMLLKHTALVVPILIVLYGMAWVIARRVSLKTVVMHAGIGVAIVLLAMWALLLFDVSKPKGPKDPAVLSEFERTLIEHRMPGGTYVGSIIMARTHVDRGHPAYLLGERSLHGWWYYFPVVASYKVPIGVMVMLLAAGVSLFFVKPRWEEMFLLIGFVGASAFLMQSGISIGFRHFLPAYLFLLMLATRCLAPAGNVWNVIGAIGVISAALHGESFTPNFIAYTNFPRQHIWLKISDSNLEWGQSLKQVGEWIESHPKLKKREVYVAHYLAERGPHAAAYLPAGVNVLRSENAMPTSGVLIISPTWLVSAYQAGDRYGDLRAREPIDVIAGSMLVYDLDQPIVRPAKARATSAAKKRKPGRSTLPVK